VCIVTLKCKSNYPVLEEQFGLYEAERKMNAAHEAGNPLIGTDAISVSVSALYDIFHFFSTYSHS
jgi:hypothetical protein